MRHPGSNAHSLAEYATYANFILDSRSCIRGACYSDYMRNFANKENIAPRWYKVQREFYSTVCYVALLSRIVTEMKYNNRA